MSTFVFLNTPEVIAAARSPQFQDLVMHIRSWYPGQRFQTWGIPATYLYSVSCNKNRSKLSVPDHFLLPKEIKKKIIIIIEIRRQLQSNPIQATHEFVLMAQTRNRKYIHTYVQIYSRKLDCLMVTKSTSGWRQLASRELANMLPLSKPLSLSVGLSSSRSL